MEYSGMVVVIIISTTLHPREVKCWDPQGDVYTKTPIA